MVAVNGEVMVVRPRSTVKKRFSRVVKVVYKGLGGSVGGVGKCTSNFGGAAGSGGREGLQGGACGLLFHDINNIIRGIIRRSM